MDSVLTVLGVAFSVLGGIWVVRRLVRGLRRVAGPEGAVEDARTMGLSIDWDELSVERLDRKRTFRRHVERLSEPDVPFEELAQMAHSATPGIAALGLSAIARRDDVPEKWTDDAIKSLTSCPYMIEPFIYRALVERATQQEWVVDTWFLDPGQPATIYSLKAWLGGAEPRGAAIVHIPQ